MHQSRLVLLILIVVSTGHLKAQDLESVAKAEPFKINGSIGGSLSGYTASGIEDRRDPYNWSANANLNMSFYGIQVPFSAYFTNQNTDFRQPFNQFGASPYYKWIKVHAGYRNVTFSPHTLAGHTFLGAGVELTPEKYRFAFVYGRFRRAVEANNLLGESASYKRLGYGLKLGYGDDNNFIDLILFKAKDDVNSIVNEDSSLGITPAENLVLGFNGKKMLTKKLSFELEFAKSAYSDDINSEITENPNGIYSATSGLYTARTTTSYNNAIQSGLGYQGEGYQLKLMYKRVEGDYKTMGAYFFNNDLEDITLSAGWQMLKKKMNINGAIGFQHNNLKNTEASKTTRLIGSANINYLVTQQLNLGLAFSNFSSSIQAIRDDVTDSLNFYQVSTNANFNANYSFGSKEHKQSLSLNTGFQVANARDEYRISEQITTFQNTILSYRYNIHPIGLTWTLAGNYNKMQSDVLDLTNIGPTVGIGKDLFEKKIKVGLFNSYLLRTTSGNADGYTYTARLSVGYKFYKKHNISFNTTYVNRKSDTQNFSEVRGTVNYRYSF